LRGSRAHHGENVIAPRRTLCAHRSYGHPHGSLRTSRYVLVCHCGRLRSKGTLAHISWNPSYPSLGRPIVGEAFLGAWRLLTSDEARLASSSATSHTLTPRRMMFRTPPSDWVSSRVAFLFAGRFLCVRLTRRLRGIELVSLPGFSTTSCRKLRSKISSSGQIARAAVRYSFSNG
jgi:hypothetical protein